MSERPTAAGGEENRKHKRSRAAFIVTYRLREPIHVHLASEGLHFTAVALDISAGGIGVVITEPVVLSQTILVSFSLLNNDPAGPDREMRRWFELTGKALYCTQVPKAGYRAGIQFKNVPQEDREFIAQFVDNAELKKQAL